MTTKADDWTGALNLITHGEDLDNYHRLVTRYYSLNRDLCTVVEMECMVEQEYILEIYDQAIGTGLRVINNDFAKATTDEEFEDMIAKMEDAVQRLEAVQRVINMCFARNFIRFR